MWYSTIFCLLALGLFVSADTIVSWPEKKTLEPRIIGGRPVSTDSLRSTVYVGTSNRTNTGRCTGTLIAPRVVLTAAHCFISESALYTRSTVQVSPSHYVPDSPRFSGYAVSGIVVHPDYRMRSLRNDIAMLILSEPVGSSEALPAKIYQGDYYLETRLLAAGFGLTNSQNHDSAAPRLMAVELAVGNTTFCRRNSSFYSSRSQICTDGTPGRDTCLGDSGDPLYTPVDNGDDDFALLGLTSHGTITPDNPEGICGHPGSSGYYTHIAYYLSWIAREADLDLDDIQVTNRTSSGTRINGSRDSDDDESTSLTDVLATASDYYSDDEQRSSLLSAIEPETLTDSASTTCLALCAVWFAALAYV